MPEYNNSIKAEETRIDKLDHIEDRQITGDPDQIDRFTDTYINKLDELMVDLEKSNLTDAQKDAVKKGLLQMLGEVVGPQEMEQFEPEFRAKIDGYLLEAKEGNFVKTPKEEYEEQLTKLNTVRAKAEKLEAAGKEAEAIKLLHEYLDPLDQQQAQLNFDTEYGERLDQARIMLATLSKGDDKAQVETVNQVQRNVFLRNLCADLWVHYSHVPTEFAAAFKDNKNFTLWFDAKSASFKPEFFKLPKEFQDRFLVYLQAKVRGLQINRDLQEARLSGEKEEELTFFAAQKAMMSGDLINSSRLLLEYKDRASKVGRPFDHTWDEKRTECLKETDVLLQKIALRHCDEVEADLQKLASSRDQHKNRDERVWADTALENVERARAMINEKPGSTFADAVRKIGYIADHKEPYLIGTSGFDKYPLIFCLAAAETTEERDRIALKLVEKLKEIGGSTDLARELSDRALSEDLSKVDVSEKRKNELHALASAEAVKHRREAVGSLEARRDEMAKRMAEIDEQEIDDNREYPSARVLNNEIESERNQLKAQMRALTVDGNPDGEIKSDIITQTTEESIEEIYRIMLRKERYLYIGKKQVMSRGGWSLARSAIDMDDMRDENILTTDQAIKLFDTVASVVIETAMMLPGARLASLAKLGLTMAMAKQLAKGGIRKFLAKKLIAVGRAGAMSFGVRGMGRTLGAMQLLSQGKDASEAYDGFAKEWAQSTLMFLAIDVGAASLAGTLGKAAVVTGRGATGAAESVTALSDVTFAQSPGMWVGYQAAKIATEIEMMSQADSLGAAVGLNPDSSAEEWETKLANLKMLFEFRIAGKIMHSETVAEGEKRIARKTREIEKRAEMAEPESVISKTLSKIGIASTDAEFKKLKVDPTDRAWITLLNNYYYKVLCLTKKVVIRGEVYKIEGRTKSDQDLVLKLRSLDGEKTLEVVVDQDSLPSLEIKGGPLALRSFSRFKRLAGRLKEEQAPLIPHGNPDMDVSVLLNKMRSLKGPDLLEVGPNEKPQTTKKLEKLDPEKQEQRRAEVEAIKQIIRDQAKLLKKIIAGVEEYLESNPGATFKDLQEKFINKETQESLSPDQVRKLNSRLYELIERITNVKKYAPEIEKDPKKYAEIIFGFKRGKLKGEIKVVISKSTITFVVENPEDFKALHGENLSLSEVEKLGGFTSSRSAIPELEGTICVSKKYDSDEALKHVTVHEDRHRKNSLVHAEENGYGRAYNKGEDSPISRAKDEITAYLTDGTTIDGIADTLLKSDSIYDYFEGQREKAVKSKDPKKIAEVDKEEARYRKSIMRYLDIANRVRDENGQIDIELLGLVPINSWHHFVNTPKDSPLLLEASAKMAPYYSVERMAKKLDDLGLHEYAEIITNPKVKVSDVDGEPISTEAERKEYFKNILEIVELVNEAKKMGVNLEARDIFEANQTPDGKPVRALAEKEAYVRDLLYLGELSTRLREYGFTTEAADLLDFSKTTASPYETDISSLKARKKHGVDLDLIGVLSRRIASVGFTTEAADLLDFSKTTSGPCGTDISRIEARIAYGAKLRDIHGASERLKVAGFITEGADLLDFSKTSSGPYGTDISTLNARWLYGQDLASLVWYASKLRDLGFKDQAADLGNFEKTVSGPYGTDISSLMARRAYGEKLHQLSLITDNLKEAGFTAEAADILDLNKKTSGPYNTDISSMDARFAYCDTLMNLKRISDNLLHNGFGIESVDILNFGRYFARTDGSDLSTFEARVNYGKLMYLKFYTNRLKEKGFEEEAKGILDFSKPYVDRRGDTIEGGVDGRTSYVKGLLGMEQPMTVTFNPPNTP